MLLLDKVFCLLLHLQSHLGIDIIRQSQNSNLQHTMFSLVGFIFCFVTVCCLSQTLAAVLILECAVTLYTSTDLKLGDALKKACSRLGGVDIAIVEAFPFHTNPTMMRTIWVFSYSTSLVSVWHHFLKLILKNFTVSFI